MSIVIFIGLLCFVEERCDASLMVDIQISFEVHKYIPTNYLTFTKIRLETLKKNIQYNCGKKGKLF